MKFHEISRGEISEPDFRAAISLGVKNSKFYHEFSRLAGAAPQAGAAMRLEASAAGISPRSAYHMISLSLLGSPHCHASG